MRFCNLGCLAQIMRLQKEERGDGPCIRRGDGGGLRTAMGAFRCENMRIELVAGGVLNPGPLGRFFGSALFVDVG